MMRNLRCAAELQDDSTVFLFPAMNFWNVHGNLFIKLKPVTHIGLLSYGTRWRVTGWLVPEDSKGC